MIPNSGGLGVDARALDELRRQASQDPRAAARAAAVQFDALFSQMMLKSMRDATPSSDGAAHDNFTAMLDAQFAQRFAGRPGGLADVIERQLTRHMPGATAPAGAASPSAAKAAAVPAPAAPSTVDRVAGAKAAGTRAADFIRRMLPHAQEAERRTGVPACFILGQAGLESGWGKCEIRKADGSTSHNLFGMKATRKWDGATADAMTTEFVGGTAQRQRASFRSYDSYADAFSDYARMLASQPRYRGVLAQASTPESFATGMQRAGYATDPAYAAKLTRTIHQAMAVQRSVGVA